MTPTRRRCLVFGSVATVAAVFGTVAARATRTGPESAATPWLDVLLCRAPAAGTSPAERRRAERRRRARERVARADAQ